MDKKTVLYKDSKGNIVSTEVDLNKYLGKKSKKNSKLKKKIATKAIVLTIGAGLVIGGTCLLFKACDNIEEQAPTTSTTAPTTSTTDSTFDKLRFNPNTKESVIDNSVLLIEEAFKSGVELDAEDAVLAVIAANSNELSAGFMGELFGERADQTYTYSSIVDAYLRVCMMQNENVAFATDDDIAFNIENVFANEEDYNFLCTIRDLTTRFNNSTDKEEKAEITEQLNQIADSLCTNDVYDISSPAGIISMLTLDGMRAVTRNSANPILHDDIRDEMFGNGDYGCTKEATFSTPEGQVLQTAYSFRVSDLKLDTIKTKLDNAVLEEGKTVILDEIIAQVKEQTKDLKPAETDPNEKTNEKAEENRETPYDYESTPGTVKPNYSEKTDNDVTQTVNGKDVIVAGGETTNNNGSNNNANNQSQTGTQTTIPSQDVITSTVPEIKVEENVKPEKGEEVFDNKQEAEEHLKNEWEKAQVDSDQGSLDGEYYGKNGLAKPSFEGKSEFYINAFNPNYEFWHNKYLNSQPAAAYESYDLGGLSVEQLEELKNAAMGEEEYIQTEEKTK